MLTSTFFCWLFPVVGVEIQMTWKALENEQTKCKTALKVKLFIFP